MKMHRALAVLALTALCLMAGGTILGQVCNFSQNGCGSGAKRTCFKTYIGSGLAGCTGGFVLVAPATAAATSGNTTFRVFSCFASVGQMMGACDFNNCGVCGTFKVDMDTGLPVELMDFSIEDEVASGIEGDSGGERRGSSGGGRGSSLAPLRNLASGPASG